MYPCADGKWSLQELLHTGLPAPLDMSDSYQSKRDSDHDWDTHPEEVLEWPDWEAWVKGVIQRVTSVSLLSSSTGHLSLHYKMGSNCFSCLQDLLPEECTSCNILVCA